VNAELFRLRPTAVIILQPTSFRLARNLGGIPQLAIIVLAWWKKS
jgi:hypothetical protein